MSARGRYRNRISFVKLEHSPGSRKAKYWSFCVRNGLTIFVQRIAMESIWPDSERLTGDAGALGIIESRATVSANRRS